MVSRDTAVSRAAQSSIVINSIVIQAWPPSLSTTPRPTSFDTRLLSLGPWWAPWVSNPQPAD